MESDEDEELTLSVNRRKNTANPNIEEGKSLLSDLDSATENEQESNPLEPTASQLNSLSSLIDNNSVSPQSNPQPAPTENEEVTVVVANTVANTSNTEQPNRTFLENLSLAGRIIGGAIISSSLWRFIAFTCSNNLYRKGNYFACLYLIPLTLALVFTFLYHLNM